MRMRDIITIVEGVAKPAAPIDQHTLDTILQHLHDFVTRGPIVDELMDEVWRDWPRPTQPMTLYRVHVLSTAQVKRLAGGLSLAVHRYLSWTSAPNTIPRLAHARQGKGVVVVIKLEVPPEAICIDVQAFVNYLHNLERTDPDLDFATSDIMQFADESEVIVAHHSKLVLDRENCTIWEAAKVAPPKPGDKFWHPHTLSDDTFSIDRVLADNGDSTWQIEGDGDEFTVHNMAPGEWETI